MKDTPLAALKRLVMTHAPPTVRHWAIRRDVGRAPATVWYMEAASLLYIQVPKVATRSIRAALGHWQLPDVHLGWRSARRGADRFERPMTPAQIAAVPESVYRFAFVRDPLDRLASCYRDKVALRPDGGAPRLARTVYPAFGIRPGMPFPEFVAAVADTPDDQAERHFRSQFTFLYDGDDPVVDSVGQVEELDSAWAALQARFDLPDLPVLNRTRGGRVDESPFTYEVAKMAARRYARDIELLNYHEAVERRLDALRNR